MSAITYNRIKTISVKRTSSLCRIFLHSFLFFREAILEWRLFSILTFCVNYRLSFFSVNLLCFDFFGQCLRITATYIVRCFALTIYLHLFYRLIGGNEDVS